MGNSLARRPGTLGLRRRWPRTCRAPWTWIRLAAMAGSAVCGDGQKRVTRHELFSIACRTGGWDRSASFHL